MVVALVWSYTPNKTTKLPICYKNYLNIMLKSDNLWILKILTVISYIKTPEIERFFKSIPTYSKLLKLQ